MCYAIPGKIDSMNGKIVFVDYFGEKKKAVNEFLSLCEGDYVFVQGGFVIEKLSVPEAEESLKEWRDMFFKLKEIDKSISGFDPKKESTEKVVAVTNRLDKGKEPSADDIRLLLSIKDAEELKSLYRAANFIRQKYHNNACCVHGIIEISNACSKDCHYCGISTWNKGLKRYRMTREEILSAVDEAVGKYGFRALVLQSAEDAAYSTEELCGVIRAIKEKHGVLIFVSFGEVGKEALEKIYEAGARGLLMRFETSNGEIFKKLHPASSLEKRIKEIKTAYDLGYLIVTGALIGLPGATDDDIINDILLAKELKAEMFSFGPFIPHPGTPLKESISPNEEDILKVIAISRLSAHKDAKILVTTGFETLSKTARERGLTSGASTVMINVTPEKYRKLYSIYPNRAHEEEPIASQIKDTIDLLKKLGRAPTDLGMGSAGMT